jgi:hypothetical protein
MGQEPGAKAATALHVELRARKINSDTALAELASGSCLQTDFIS